MRQTLPHPTLAMEQITEFFCHLKKTTTIIAGSTSPGEVVVTDLAHVYFVGGCVRDILMGYIPKDYDLATDATPDDIIAYAKAKGRKANTVGAQFGTVKVKVPLNGGYHVIDVTTFRGDTYNGLDRRPIVTFGKSIESDLSRRDFTINAIAARSNGSLIDPHGGVADIEKRVLRAVTSKSGGPRVRFHEDPLRILRGVRMAAKYGLTIEPKTAEKMQHCRWELLRVSKERIVEEIDKMYNLREEGAVVRALNMMFSFQLWQIICPPLQRQHNFDQQNPHHHFKLHDHSIAVAASAIAEIHELHDKDDPPLNSCRFECAARAGWAGMLHDVAKPDVKEPHKSGNRFTYIGHEILGAEMVEGWARQYKWSNERREFIVHTVLHHLEDHNWLRPHDRAGKMPLTDASYYLPGGAPGDRSKA